MQKALVAGFGFYAFVVICTTSAISLHRDFIELPVVRTPPSCMLGRNHMEGDIPDPFNCHLFYTCAPGEEGGTTAQNRTCPSNLYFSFRTCRCEFDISGCCIGCLNAEFFNCTTIYDPSIRDEESTETIPILSQSNSLM
ncbi:hypothetical protein Ocin01_09376 [Orchesella cincta]|uniref:Chitin-binding type-2 domain-containing protein n=1 Tax=Orchesella cincta TaxID=48709 RepID=A0A1D2MWF8_ORCCI|nr:hypothetical protein Ocin01_09376 [Orchesella cincta]